MTPNDAGPNPAANAGQGSNVDRILEILTLANATAPIAIGGISALISIFKKEGTAAKTDDEIMVQWTESMAVAEDTRTKAKKQQSDEA